MAYCPIAHITSLAFADNAFENARLIPEILQKLRVPGRLHVLPLPFKKSMWNTPICRSTVQTVSGVHTDPNLFEEHEVVVRELTRVRAVHRREKKAEFREDYFETMPGVEIDK
jgi:hypothetical protein